MALSFSPAARDRLKSLFICFSLGNLIFLRRWYDLEHLLDRSVDYYRVGPADPALLLATVTSAMLVTVVFWLAWLWIQYSQSAYWRKVAQYVFLLLMMFSLDSVRIYWNGLFGHADLPSNLTLLMLEGVLLVGLGMLLFDNPRVLTAARRVALMLTLLFPPLAMDIIWSRAGGEPASAFQPKTPLAMLPVRPGIRRRFIWILFDELDERLAFDKRPESVQLPELDRLRDESLVANHVRQTASWTTIALPSLLSGEIFSRADLIDASTLKVFPQGSERGVSWSDEPNVFKRARQMGLNAELIGWHHPYCRVLGGEMVRCLEVPSGHPTAALLRETSAAEEGVVHTIAFLFRMQLENLRDMFRPARDSGSEKLRSAYSQGRQQRQYFRIRDAAYAEALDPQIDFLFLHFPTPHLYAIYDRNRGNFTLDSTTSYLDNLALVDRTIRELRQELEQAGLWESTSLLITSDHGLRPEMWRGEYNWSQELDQLTASGASETVPFILKLAGQHKALNYSKSFSAVVEGDMALAVEGGTISTPEDAAAWLDRHAAVERTHSDHPATVYSPVE